MLKQRIPKMIWLVTHVLLKILPKSVQKIKTCFGNEGVCDVSAEEVNGVM